MREISEKEAAELGIDLTMIKVCRRFRHLAKLDRLRIDMTEHRSGLNKQDRKSTRLNSSHSGQSRMPSSA